MDLVQYAVRNQVALIGLNRSPVNALSQTLRSALQESWQVASADDRVQAIVLYGYQLPFCAGADIYEFTGGQFWNTPNLPDLLESLSHSRKPVIAAIDGLALGGGLELALACGYRISEPKARLGLPEINLGLLPGAGGTQRLPRLVGVECALQMMLSGQPILAAKALEQGLIDRLADSSATLQEQAYEYACELLEKNLPAQPEAPFAEPCANLADDFFSQYPLAKVAKAKQPAARLIVQAVAQGCVLPLEQGLAVEQQLFKQAIDSASSKALRHVFFAERAAHKIPNLADSVTAKTIHSVAVIGAGTMGGGIAMSFANSGIPVLLVEQNPEALTRGLTQIRNNYQISVERGSLTADQLEQRMALLTTTVDYADLADVDLVVEAVFESMDVKRQVFTQLDSVCKDDAILASNTSTLDVDQIAAFTRRPQQVVGLHFFSPANVMRLLEVVRGKHTAPEVLVTALNLSRQLGKQAVVSGVCYGFIGNRMLAPYAREAYRLVLEGASPEQVDRVLSESGFNMGVISMYDLVGLDVGYLMREPLRQVLAQDPSYYRLADELYAQGHLGQKTGQGVYRYQGRTRQLDPEVEALAVTLADGLGISRRSISDQEIHDRCLFALINEGVQILDEGIALRASDIDLVWILGYGFAQHLGGPLYYAEQLGLTKVLQGILQYRAQLGDYGKLWFSPAPLLERLVESGQTRIGEH